MALTFPTLPAVGTRFPANPGTSGVTQYEYDGAKWNAVPSVVSLGVANQGAGVGINTFNSYQWPASDGTAGQQLTTDGSGNLAWGVPAVPSLQVLILDRPFDGSSATGKVFTLYKTGTTTPFTPNPSSNIIVFLGGVPQIPLAAYTISGSSITFLEPPLAGTTFYAISSVIA
jgi:hypothetical protein